MGNASKDYNKAAYDRLISYRSQIESVLGVSLIWNRGDDIKSCKVSYDDLIDKYENPIEHACGLEEGQVFFCEGWQKPDGFCDSAWDSVSPFIMTLAHGGENFYDGWMKNKKSAMISCNDGFRPVSFYIEVCE